MEMAKVFAIAIHDKYVANCSEEVGILRCRISSSESGKRDFVAFLRLVFALLSIIGTSSIIISVIRKRQVFNPKIHTIFMLSIADLLLAVMWVVGGALWMTGGVSEGHHSRVGCFTVLLITVILECVTMNLTCVYALLAYSSIKRKDFTNVYSLFDKDVDGHTWKPFRIFLAYLLSWIVPVVLIMVPFSVVASSFHLVKEANKCSCWCLPYFGNSVPMATANGNASAFYLHHMSMLVASYGTVIVGNYLVGFVILVVVYWKILKIIKLMKTSVLRTGTHKTYGVTSNVISKGQSMAKQRVVYFLTIFVVTGFFNLILSFAFVFHESIELSKVPSIEESERKMSTPVFTAYIFQSITIPLQGFLNAIVYGWTRQDFITAVRSNTVNVRNEDNRLFNEQAAAQSDSYGSVADSRLLVNSSNEGGGSLYGRSLAGRDLLFSIPEQPDS